MIYMLFNALGIFLTVITIHLCAEVVWKWRSQLGDFWKGEREPWAWAGMGVFVHFFGSFLDNIYWGAAWSTMFAGWEIADFLFHNGIIANIPFRQLSTIGAAYCYLMAVVKFKELSVVGINSRLVVSTLTGLLWIVFLML